MLRRGARKKGGNQGARAREIARSLFMARKFQLEEVSGESVRVTQSTVSRIFFLRMAVLAGFHLVKFEIPGFRWRKKRKPPSSIKFRSFKPKSN